MPGASFPKRLRVAALLVFAAAALAGCGEKLPNVVASKGVRPALIEQVGAADAAPKLRFPGRLRAAKRAELSFNVPGFVAEFSLPEGSQVQAGEIVARLDDAVFRSRLNAAQAEFDRAKTDFERYERLLETAQAVTRAEVDARRSTLESARTGLAAAQQDLADTLIRAPFSGVITRRRLETFANVQAKQPIAELQDPASLEVVIHVPQRMLRNEGAQAEARALFEDREDLPLPLVLKSYATESDPVTQTYEVVLTVRSIPAGLTLLPGMSVTVLPFTAQPVAADQTLSISLTAVASDATGGRFVWVVGPDGQVSRTKVELGDIRAGRVIVLSGLSAGQSIVAAGTSALREGMKVRPLEAR